MASQSMPLEENSASARMNISTSTGVSGILGISMRSPMFEVQATGCLGLAQTHRWPKPSHSPSEQP